MKYKDKNTGKIVTLVYETSSCEGKTVTISDRGVIKTIKASAFEKIYTPVDLEELLEENIEQFKYFITNNRSGIKFLRTVLRRLTKGGYFHVGDIVFFNEGSYIRPDRQEFINYELGQQHPYIISGIRKEADRELYWITLQYGTVIQENSGTIRIPMYLDAYTENDAFTVLTRFDMPY